VANNAESGARAFGSLAAIIALVGGMWGLLNQQELSLQRQIAPIRINQGIILSDLQKLEEKFQSHVNDGHPDALKLLLKSDIQNIQKEIENMRASVNDLGKKISAMELRKSTQ
jgi:hypothetical protein